MSRRVKIEEKQIKKDRKERKEKKLGMDNEKYVDNCSYIRRRLEKNELVDILTLILLIDTMYPNNRN